MKYKLAEKETDNAYEWAVWCIINELAENEAVVDDHFLRIPKLLHKEMGLASPIVLGELSGNLGAWRRALEIAQHFSKRAAEAESRA